MEAEHGGATVGNQAAQGLYLTGTHPVQGDKSVMHHGIHVSTLGNRLSHTGDSLATGVACIDPILCFMRLVSVARNMINFPLVTVTSSAPS